MPALDNEQWRLGHRRPWWQWNVITLMVALFALVWLRELSNMDYYATWLLSAIVLVAWSLFPLIVEAGRTMATEIVIERAKSPPVPSSRSERILRFVVFAMLMLAWLMLALAGLMG